jgi:trimethylamine--corrinoid protein Co-methyltransferase
VISALETTLDRFKFHARNPEKSLWIGRHDYALAPIYGPPFIVEADRSHRACTMADCEKAFKLVQTSPVLDFNAFKYIAPSDVPANTSYFDMVRSALVLSDKPMIGSTDSKLATENAMKLLEIVFGPNFLSYLY